MPKQYAVYILASKAKGTLYIGVTGHLVNRIWQHRNAVSEGFTCGYGVNLLVWYELHVDVTKAIRREKQLKQWKRDWKIRLVERMNPDWLDLWEDIIR